MNGLCPGDFLSRDYHNPAPQLRVHRQGGEGDEAVLTAVTDQWAQAGYLLRVTLLAALCSPLLPLPCGQSTHHTVQSTRHWLAAGGVSAPAHSMTRLPTS